MYLSGYPVLYCTVLYAVDARYSSSLLLLLHRLLDLPVNCAVKFGHPAHEFREVGHFSAVLVLLVLLGTSGSSPGKLDILVQLQGRLVGDPYM